MIIRFKTNILKQIFASMRKYKANIRSEAKYSLQHVFVMYQIKYLYENFCEYFEANVKWMMQINGVCE